MKKLKKSLKKFFNGVNKEEMLTRRAMKFCCGTMCSYSTNS